ncbi:MAG: hypothetical protein M1833_006773 [Piccolia ochrophora]|nr:MAG: hypothetical protein M1833_006773 [Piccolia ochrophora]
MSTGSPTQSRGEAGNSSDPFAAPTSQSVNGSPSNTRTTKEAAIDSMCLAAVAIPIHSQQRLGPVAQGVKSEYANTTDELANLKNARTRPTETTATGQPLTHYHSMFYNLLSWQNPRATAIAFTATVLFIFAARYFHILRYLFKVLSFTFGVTAAAEILGSALIGNGLVSQVRPKRYYTLPKDSVDRALDDVHELLNFFVIEFQRVLFAEKPANTAAAFSAAIVSYFLIKFVPLWGLSLIATSVAYLAPLVYIKNKEAIDSQIQSASNVVNQQANQMRDLAGQHTSRATSNLKSYAGDYSAKAQEYIGSARNRVPSGSSKGGITPTDFPNAPKTNPGGAEQYRSTSGTNPVPAS